MDAAVPDAAARVITGFFGVVAGDLCAESRLSLPIQGVFRARRARHRLNAKFVGFGTENAGPARGVKTIHCPATSNAAPVSPAHAA